MTELSTRTRGVLIVGAGVLVLSPDGLVVRLLTMDNATVVLWRGVWGCLGYLILVRIVFGRLLSREIWAIGVAGLAVGGLTMVGNIVFVTSIRHTTVAHALLIIASAPVFTAIISRVFIAEPVPRRIWLTTAGVLTGVAVIFSTRLEPGHLTGDLIALGGAITLATLWVVLRQARQESIVPALAVGGLITAIVAIPFAEPFSGTTTDAMLVGAHGLIVLPLALVLITQGPRYLSAPAVSLMMLIETILGPLWVWGALGERPSTQTVLAGMLILGALAANAVLAAREPAGDGPRERVA